MDAMTKVEEGILDDLRQLGDPLLQCAYLIECGRSLPRLDDSLRTDAALVAECEVDTWFAVEEEADGPRRLRADSDSLIVRGALALVAEVLEAGEGSQWAAHRWRLLDAPEFACNFTPAQLRGMRSALDRL